MSKVTNTPYTMKSLFTESQCQFIIKNYPSRGAAFCAEQLKMPIKQVKLKINKLRNKFHFKMSDELKNKTISETRHIKSFNEYAVNPTQFFNIQTKESAYLLGLIWADGYIYSVGYNNQISIEMLRYDLEELKPLFMSTGKWITDYRKRINRKSQMRISTTNKPLVKFLLKNDYKSKSELSASKILECIPDYLKHYWFLGLIDGDGCFYINSKNHCYQFSISSSYNQDWSYVENLLNALGISYNIYRRKQIRYNKTNKSSVIRVTNKKDIEKLGHYIYKCYPEDNIGLNRKYKKYKSIINDGQLDDIAY